VVSTTPARDVNTALLDALRHHRYPGKVAVTAHSVIDKDALERTGAHLVLLPYADAADQAVDLLTEPGASAQRPAPERDAEIDASPA
jgi:Trk K+ transport system NAD-binding subunit